MLKQVNRPEGKLDAHFGGDSLESGIAVVVHKDDFLRPGLGQVVHHALKALAQNGFVAHVGEEHIAEIVLPLEKGDGLEELTLDGPGHVALHDADGHDALRGRYGLRLPFGLEPRGHVGTHLRVGEIARLLHALHDEIERPGLCRAILVAGHAGHAVINPLGLLSRGELAKSRRSALFVELQILAAGQTLAAIVASIFVKHNLYLTSRIPGESLYAY